MVSYLSRSTSECDSLIKFEINSIQDFSFQISLQIWKNYFKVDLEDEEFQNNILIYAACAKNIELLETIDMLKKASDPWIFTIDKIFIDKGICYISLNHHGTFKMLLNLIDGDEYGKADKKESVKISIKTQKILKSSITQFRLETIERILRNLLNFSPFVLTDDPSHADVPLLLTTRSNLKADEKDKAFKSIVCAVVYDEDENCKKTSCVEALNYLEKRQNDMHLIAVHKFGIRIKNDKV